jgi:protein arginine kinase activator
MHKGTVHKGKIPARVALTQEFESRLKALHLDLLNAVKAEDYEQAAALRDEISTLEASRKF